LKNEREERRQTAVHAYLNERFVKSASARSLRILSEYLEPKSRFEHFRVDDTIVFMGSARIASREQAIQRLRAAEQGSEDLDLARRRLELSRYYEAARDLAARLTKWSKQLEDEERRFVVCTGGGPGIMEAANRGASEARGLNIGLAISMPTEQFDNPYVTRELALQFHYFFMRKFWFALVVYGRTEALEALQQRRRGQLAAREQEEAIAKQDQISARERIEQGESKPRKD
jgi:predicted Rossmann-fold nucleotide-binding protein